MKPASQELTHCR